MVPEFVSAVGRVRYDVYNVHTVDVHAIRAADVLRALVRGEHASKWPTASSIAADSTRLEPLFLACILQEIGLEPDINSTAPVASLTREVGKRLGFTDADANHAAFLARNQMKLYVAATRRDVLDPSLIAEVARWAKSVEQLRDLYLLCFANLWATNSTMMTEWKSDLLTRLGELVARQLEGEPLDTSENRVRIIRREVRVGFMGEPEVEELEAYLEDMSPRYLLGNEVEAIREHAFTAVQRHAGAAIVREVRLPIGGRREIVIVADERRGFLADVSVCLAKHGISVLGAQVYARKRRRRSPEVVGLFELEPAGYAETISDEVIKELQEDLTSIVTGEVDAETFLQMNAASERTPSSSIQVSTKVVLSNDATSESTLIDVYTQDRPGVLYAITRAIRDLNIEILFARINTEGVRVVDAFYVTEADGRKIVDQDRLRVLRESIVHSLYAEMKR